MYDEAVTQHERSAATNPAWGWIQAYAAAVVGRSAEARRLAARERRKGLIHDPRLIAAGPARQHRGEWVGRPIARWLAERHPLT